MLYFIMLPRLHTSTLFPYTTLFRSLMFATEMGSTSEGAHKVFLRPETAQGIFVNFLNVQKTGRLKIPFGIAQIDRKSTRLNSSHVRISYAVFCLKKKNNSLYYYLFL